MRYRRIKMPGASYFFTLNLAERTSQLLVAEVDKLKFAFRKVRTVFPFVLNEIVILPDHLHMLMTLPDGDANYSQRINLIKGHFSQTIEPIERKSVSRIKKRERGIWQRRFWEHLLEMNWSIDM